MSLESRKFSDEEIAVDVQFVKEILDRVFQGLRYGLSCQYLLINLLL